MLVAITALAGVGFPAFPTVAQGVLAPTDPTVPTDRTAGMPTNRTLWLHANHACVTNECDTAIVVDEEGTVWALGETATRVGTINDDNDDDYDDDDDVLVLFALSVFFWFSLIYTACLLLSLLLFWDAVPRIVRTGVSFLGSFLVLDVFFRLDKLLFTTILGAPTHWHYAPHRLLYFNLRWLLSYVLAIMLCFLAREAHFAVFGKAKGPKIKAAVTEEEPPSWV